MVSRDGRWRIEQQGAGAGQTLVVYSTSPGSRRQVAVYRAARLDLVLAWLAEQGVSIEDLEER